MMTRSTKMILVETMGVRIKDKAAIKDTITSSSRSREVDQEAEVIYKISSCKIEGNLKTIERESLTINSK